MFLAAVSDTCIEITRIDDTRIDNTCIDNTCIDDTYTVKPNKNAANRSDI